MTEEQALILARAVVRDWGIGGMHAWDEKVSERFADTIKEALMDAYNSGWENGFEAGKGDMEYGE